MKSSGPNAQDTTRINREITDPKVRLIDSEGEMRGIVSIKEALKIAEEANLDLVEVSPGAEPPVCKVLDYGKHKYQQQKRAAEARKNQKTIEVKEVKMRPNIDTHDYEVKMKNARKFLDQGNKVKFTLRFRGREMAHQNLGMELLERVLSELEELTKVDAKPKMEGRQMMMILSPKTGA